jgi:hypothetical protein
MSYLAFVLTLKTRLALWSVLPPHPSLSPVWIFTLGVGPLLLFKTLEAMLRDRPAALAGTAVYLVSTGLLSGVTMLFHPAKALANVLVIAVLFVSVRIDRARAPGTAAPAPPAGPFAALLALLMLSPFVDEMCVFAYFIPLVWCSWLFWPARGVRPEWSGYVRNWLMLGAPAIATAVLLFVVAPRVAAAFAPFSFDFGAYLTNMAHEGAWHDGVRSVKFSPARLAWHAGNLLIPFLMPWRLAGVTTPVTDAPVLPVAALAGLTAAFSAASLLVSSMPVLWRPYRKLALLAALFVVLLTCAFLFHDQELAATGFYYGSIFSVLFAALAAVIFAAIRDSRLGVWPARAALMWVLAISMVNFVAINASYRAHSNTILIDQLTSGSVEIADWRGVKEMQATLSAVDPERAPAIEWAYAPEAAQAKSAAPFGDVLAMWKSWRRGEVDFVGDRPATLQNAWAIVELKFIQLGGRF